MTSFFGQGTVFGNTDMSAPRSLFEEAVRLENAYLATKAKGFPENESINLDGLYMTWAKNASPVLYDQARYGSDPYYKALSDAYTVMNSHVNEIRLHWPLAGRGRGFIEEFSGEIEKQKTVVVDFTKMLVLGGGILALILYLTKK